MAVPTFTSITPSEGVAIGRYLVEIIGTNFRPTPDPPVDGYVGGDYTRTVSVQFDGVESEDVMVLLETKLLVRIPSYHGDPEADQLPIVDVRVANLDDDGDEIAGENVTEAAAFQYYRPALDGESDFKRITRELIKLFKRQVLKNVSYKAHTDYADDPMATIAYMSELPGIVLMGPDTRKNDVYRTNEPIEVEDEIETFANLHRSPVTRDLVFRLVGAADHSNTLLELFNAVEQFFEANDWIVMDRDPGDSAKGTVQWELEMEDPFAVDTNANDDNVGRFSGSFVVVGFDFEPGVHTRVDIVDDEVDLEVQKA